MAGLLGMGCGARATSSLAMALPLNPVGATNLTQMDPNGGDYRDRGTTIIPRYGYKYGNTGYSAKAATSSTMGLSHVLIPIASPPLPLCTLVCTYLCMHACMHMYVCTPTAVLVSASTGVQLERGDGASSLG